MVTTSGKTSRLRAAGGPNLAASRSPSSIPAGIEASSGAAALAAAGL